MNGRPTFLAAGMLACALLAAAVHLPALRAEPVLDDVAVLEHPVSQGPLRARDVLAGRHFGDRAAYHHIGNFRPLTLLTYRLPFAGEIRAQRAWSMVMHACVAAAVFWLALVLGAARWAALGCGLLFAVHPLHVDAVVPLNNRSELVCALLMVLAVGLWASSRRPAGVLAAALAAALAPMAKEQGFVLPVALLLVTMAMREPGTRTPRWRWAALGCVWAAAVAVLAFRAHMLGSLLGTPVSPSDNLLVDADGAARWLGPGRVALLACRLLVWPWPLSADYTADAIALPTGWADPAGWAGVLLLIGGGCYVLLSTLAGRLRFVATAGTALLAYGVVSNLVLRSTIIFAERLLYGPSAFLAAGLALVATRRGLPPRPARAVAAAAVAAALLTGAAASWVRAADHQDAHSLAQSSLRATPRSARMWSLLGETYRLEGDMERAGRSFERAIELDPGCVSALGGMGLVLMTRGDFDASARFSDRALEQSRGHDAAAATNACLAHLRASRPETAAARCRLAIELGPELALPRVHLARALQALGRKDQAREQIERASALAPDDLLVLVHLMRIRALHGDREGAAKAYERALARYPDDARLRGLADSLKLTR